MDDCRVNSRQSPYPDTRRQGMEKRTEIKRLTKAYSNGRGSKDMSWDIFQGDIFGFLGPNGAGKTTAMKIMTGLVRPERGDVKIYGYSVLEDYELAMDKVGCLIEIAEAYSYMSAFDNLKQLARYYSDAVSYTHL